jgi:hypothetical protein
MANRPKAIGTACETAVVRYLQASGFPHAERRALRGELDAGDVTGCPGIAIEVKGGEAAKSASDAQIEAWLVETETERINASAEIGLLIMQRKAVGPKNAGRWWATLRLDHVLSGDDSIRSSPSWPTVRDIPVRMHLSDAVHLLRAAGYGNPLEAS